MDDQIKETDEQRLLEWAWTILANVDQGNWDQTEEWTEAVTKWRDEYHKIIMVKGV